MPLDERRVLPDGPGDWALQRVAWDWLLLAACGTSFKDPINVQLASGPPRAIPSGLPEVGGGTVVALAFSGGRTRAAAFAHGVMRGLDRIPAATWGTYFDKIVFISGVSGGSIAAAYYGLRGRPALDDFRERFLLKNAEEDLDTQLRAPRKIPLATSSRI